MAIKVNTIIEIVGKPKEHIDQTMDKVIELVTNNKDFKLIKHDKAPTKEVNNLWSTFTEFEIEFPNIEILTGFCFDFMPSSVEITEPEKLNINSKEVENSLNDVLAKIHQYDMVLKKYLMQEMAAKKQQQK